MPVNKTRKREADGMDLDKPALTLPILTTTVKVLQLGLFRALIWHDGDKTNSLLTLFWCHKSQLI